MVEFFAPWCPACQGFAPTWERFAGWSEGKEVRVAQVNVQEEMGLSGQFLISQLPTICHIKDGEVRFMDFSGTYDSLVSYVENETWKIKEPVPWWKNPLSPHFRVLGKVVDMTKFAQVAYEKLTIEYGFSNYAVFGMAIGATIVLGFVFGGIMVACCECFGRVFGPKSPPKQQPKKQTKGSEGKSVKPEEISSSKPAGSEEPKSTRKRKNVKIEYDEPSPQGESMDRGSSPKKQGGKKGRMKAEQ